MVAGDHRADAAGTEIEGHIRFFGQFACAMILCADLRLGIGRAPQRFVGDGSGGNRIGKLRTDAAGEVSVERKRNKIRRTAETGTAVRRLQKKKLLHLPKRGSEAAFFVWGIGKSLNKPIDTV